MNTEGQSCSSSHSSSSPIESSRPGRTGDTELRGILHPAAARHLTKCPAHLVIVRHAQSERNVWKEIATAQGDFIYRGEVRDIDVGLTPIGESQALATGTALGGQFRFDRLLVSPFARTVQSAQIMVQQFPYSVELIEDDRLREIDFGVYWRRDTVLKVEGTSLS